MPWDQRGAKRYYYQPVRVDGKPRRIYWGAGDVGRLHELLTARGRWLRAKRVASARERAATVAALQRDTRAAVTWARQLVRAVRLVGGEYQHKGQWRWRAGGRLPTSQGHTGRPPVRMTAAGHLSGRQLPSPFVLVIAMTPAPTAEPGTPEDLGRRLLELNERGNRGDRSALAELEELLDAHPVVWQTAARLAADTSNGWARLHGGGSVSEACLRRELAAWKAGLAGLDSTPLVMSAVDVAATAWLAQRFAEGELLRAGEKKRPAAVRQLTAANRQVQEALKLVIAARASTDTVRDTAVDKTEHTGGPRLFGGTAG